MEHNMANITKNNMKCPFLIVNKFCSHKYNGNGVSRHRKICSLKDCNKCSLYQEWLENKEDYELNNKVSPGVVSAPVAIITQPTRPKRCKICKKILASYNKSGYCSFHLKFKNKKND